MEDKYIFEQRVDAKRYEDLLVTIRCAVCENQSLGDSNAPLAEDLRQSVYAQVVAGKSDADIKAFLVERYGESVLYDPPLQSNTVLLWLGPLLMVIVGIGVWWFYVRKR